MGQEIIVVACVSSASILLGLIVGFALLKAQGE